MDVINCTDISNIIEAVGIDDANEEESQSMACGEKSVNMDAEDTVEEVEDESVIQNDANDEAEPQVAEQIETAVVTCAKDESDDADSSLEIFFDINNEEVGDTTQVELQIEVNNKIINEELNEDENDEPINQVTETEEMLLEEDKEKNIQPEEKDKEEEAEPNLLTNGNTSPNAGIIEHKDDAAKPDISATQTLISDDIVILSDDEPEPEIEKQQDNNEEKNEEKLESTDKVVSSDEKEEKITVAVTEILEDSNNSDSSNLLEISTVQEEREKERLQEPSGEEDEEDEEEDADAEADADADAEGEDEETVTENDIEVVESNLDNDMMCSPPAKRSKLSEEKKEEEEEKENVLPENNVELINDDKMEIMTSNEEENKTDTTLNNDNTIEESEKPADIEMEIEPTTTTTTTTATKISEECIKSNEHMENGIDLPAMETNSSLILKVPLPFLRKFKKDFGNMNRTELEEFVSQKIIEAIVYQSQFSELNKQLKIQEQITERHRNHISELSKQLRDLNMVHTRVLKDLEEHYSQIVLPVKITRAVGLQVCIPKRGESSTKKEQQQQQQQQQGAANKDSVTTNAPKMLKHQTQTGPTYLQTYLDANKPSTSSAAKEAAAAAVAAASLQTRKINTIT